MSEQVAKPTALDYATEIAREIQSIVSGSIVTVVNPTTIQIDNGGIISSVRVRDARKGSFADVKITHGGKSKYEDTGAKVVGDSYVYKEQIVANIKEKAIKDIANESTAWDINNISEAYADQHNAVRIHEHPSIHWARAFNANGKVGISVEVQTPNGEQWIAFKKSHAKDTVKVSPAPVIPSGKIIFKIISEEDVDFIIERDNVSIQGTIAQVDKVIARITGNPFSDW
jgi:hypothetical protein